MSGSAFSAGYAEIHDSPRGLTEPMKRVSEVAGACLTCSKNKLEVLEGTPALLCSSAGLFIQLYKEPGLVQHAVASGICWAGGGGTRPPAPNVGCSALTLASKMTVFTSRSEFKSWSSPALLWYPGQACGRAVT